MLGEKKKKLLDGFFFFEGLLKVHLFIVCKFNFSCEKIK